MTKTRRMLATLVAGAAAAVIAFAPAAATSADLDDYVSVSNNGGIVHVGTGVPGQPLVGATVDTGTGRVCLGFSYQMPTCTTDLSFSVAAAAIPSPVWVDADPSDGSIGAGVRIGTGSIVAVRYYGTTGQLCVGIGMQRPFCAVIA
ncbi:MAG TPA: hypothetical protein VF230_15235 [Acidimicrobiales bacterium]